ncbi:MAG: hypothetical protein ACREEM_19445 [Blastocatellia bacterium]
MTPFSTYIDERQLPLNPSRGLPAGAGVPGGAFTSVSQDPNANVANVIRRPVGATQDSPSIYGSANNVLLLNRDNKNGRVQQWNFFVERQFGGVWLVSAGYVGTKGARLPFARWNLVDTQDIDPATLVSWRQTLISTGVNPGQQQVCNPAQTQQTCSDANTAAASGPLIAFTGAWGGRTVTRQQSLYQSPLLEGRNVGLPIGFSDYHAMQLQVNRRMASGLQLNAHYTFSKSLGFGQTEAQTNGFADGGGYDSSFIRGDFRANRQLASSDIPHRFVATAVYDLPFGKGKTFDLNNAFLNNVIGGWQLGGVINAQSGVPVQIGMSGALNNLPDLVPGAPLELPKELQKWYDGRTQATLPSGRVITPCTRCFLKYDPDAFRGRTVTRTDNNQVIADLYYFGTASQTYGGLRNPSFTNVNLTIDRAFKPREKLTVAFSARVSNLFNQAQFRPGVNGGLGAPATTGLIGSPTNQSYGTYGTSTFDPRQVEFQLKISF